MKPFHEIKSPNAEISNRPRFAHRLTTILPLLEERAGVRTDVPANLISP